MAKAYRAPFDVMLQFEDREEWKQAALVLQHHGFPARRFEMDHHGEVRVNLPAGRTVTEVKKITGMVYAYDRNYREI